MRFRPLALAAATALATATPAVAGPTEDFHALMDQYWAAALKNSPTLATSVGVDSYNAELDVLGLGEMDRQAAEAAAFLARLDAIPASSLAPADQSNRAILKRTLEAQIAANRFGQHVRKRKSEHSGEASPVAAVTVIVLFLMLSGHAAAFDHPGPSVEVPYFTPSNSTSKSSVAFGGIMAPAPLGP